MADKRALLWVVRGTERVYGIPLLVFELLPKGTCCHRIKSRTTRLSLFVKLLTGCHDYALYVIALTVNVFLKFLLVSLLRNTERNAALFSCANGCTMEHQ